MFNEYSRESKNMEPREALSIIALNRSALQEQSKLLTLIFRLLGQIQIFFLFDVGRCAII
jgi:hypothetical protein